jgi:uncharacterized protein (DUF433 family)
MPKTLSLAEAVLKDPQVMSGELVFTGTRVPVWMLFDHVRHGHPLNEFFVAYPSVTREQVDVVIESSFEEVKKVFEGTRAA